MKTVTVWVGNTPEEWPVTDPRIQAYNALEAAAFRIARTNAERYLSQLPYRGINTMKNNTLRNLRGYHISDTHRACVEAMPKVLSGEMTPEDAFGIINSYDGMKERGL